METIMMEDQGIQGLIKEMGMEGVGIFTTLAFNLRKQKGYKFRSGQTETQYISAILDRFTNFAVRNNCLMIIVAHPRKMYRELGSRKESIPNLYDINGSAAFYNKYDYGITVEGL